MGILDRGIAKVKEFNLRRKQRAQANLIKETSEIERKFAAEARRLGISLGNFNSKNYYEILGLKYTSDPKVIKDAYIALVKKYHPDLYKGADATMRSAEINAAYGVLKDKKKKEEYDAKSLKGSSKLSEETSRIISNELLMKYSKIRNKDVEDFNKRVSVPQYRDSLKAAIEEVADWNKRFKRAQNETLGKFNDYGHRIRHMESVNRNLLKNAQSDAEKSKLRENLVKIEGMGKSFQEAEKGIAIVVEKIRNDISTTENNMADKLRRSVQ